jgi:pimeloyl-ACP methyl ester carboxylesterase
MSTRRSTLPRHSRGFILLSITALTALIAGFTPAARAATPSAWHGTKKPTVVLVHGAWADSSSWDGVVSRLQHDGYQVDVFPTPLRSLSADTDALRSYLAAISGPIVLVGHSYGGAVVTDAATGNGSVQALVYLDAFAPDQGETVMSLPGPDSVLANPDSSKVFNVVPAAPPTATTDLYVLPGLFPLAFANDLPLRRARVLAATQRPVTLGALREPSTAPAWKTIPSWYEVGTIDKVIPASAQLKMAVRAHAHVVEVRSSHLPMISQPKAVTRLIEAASQATSRS